MASRILLHPTTTALAAEVLSLLVGPPLNDVTLQALTGAPLPAIRTVLSALWDSDRIAPVGADEWTVLL